MSGHFSCVIQDGGPAQALAATLAEGLADLHARHYPGEDATVAWQAMPEGWMFTEGRQSTSSIIACVTTHDMTVPQRERYMRDVCDLWTNLTGCTDHEVVVALTDVDPL